MRRKVAVALAGAVMIGSVGLSGTVLIDRYIARVTQHELHHLEQMAITGAEATRQSLQRLLEHVETLATLGELIHRYRGEGRTTRGEPLEQHLRQIAGAPTKPVLQVALIGKDGVLTWSTVQDAPRVALGDREHFRVHADGRTTPYVSVPLIGRASGRWSLQATRPLTTEIGGFDGVVVVSIDLELLRRELDALKIARTGLIGLVREDGVILARSADVPLSPEIRVTTSNLQVLRTQEAGSRLVTSSLIGHEIMLAWEHVPGWPLIAAYGLETADVKAAALRRRSELLIGFAIALAGALALAALLWALQVRRTALNLVRSDRDRAAAMLDALPGASYIAHINDAGDISGLRPTPSLLSLLGSGATQEEWNRCAGDPATASRRAAAKQALSKGYGLAEYLLTLPDGRSLWVQEHLRCTGRSIEGQREVAGLVIDITEQHEATTKAMVAAKLATLGEMATGLAHEISQPAAAIALTADVAHFRLSRGHTDPSTVMTDLQAIAQQTERLREITRQILLFGRGDPADTPHSPVSLRRALDNALTLVGNTLGEASVRLEVELPEHLPEVRAREVALEHVLVNLLLNAAHALAACAPDRRTVRISGTEDAIAGMVKLEVADTGPGFAPEMLPRAFEAFTTTKPPGEGTGLGLAIVYGTIRGFGGNVTVANRPAGGASVVIHLLTWERQSK